MVQKAQKIIAPIIKKARLGRGLSQAELAEKIGITQSRLSQIENGNGSFSAEQLITLSKFFNLPISTFDPDKPADPEAQLRNSLARLGASQLKEQPNLLPSEKLGDVYNVICETLVGGASSRLIAALVPVI